MKVYNCPVCNKSGLPDYGKTHTVCPQCNTDLKSYLLLHSKIINLFKWLILILSSFLLIVFSLNLYQHYNYTRDTQRLKHENLKGLISLQDTVAVLNNEIISLKNNSKERKGSSDEITILYKVKEGDCLSRIAQFFYNDWREYGNICVLNNLEEPFILEVGQILRIKIRVK